jgi:hypothetical protein
MRMFRRFRTREVMFVIMREMGVFSCRRRYEVEELQHAALTEASPVVRSHSRLTAGPKIKVEAICASLF